MQYLETTYEVQLSKMFKWKMCYNFNIIANKDTSTPWKKVKVW